MAQFVVSTAHGDGELFVSAARWLARFYEHVDVVVDHHSISLSSERAESLEQIWAAALLNEKSVLRNIDQRRRYLERMVS